MLLRNGIICAMKVPYSKKQEFQKQTIWLAEDVKQMDQCPVEDVNVSWKLDHSVLKVMVIYGFIPRCLMGLARAFSFYCLKEFVSMPWKVFLCK